VLGQEEEGWLADYDHGSRIVSVSVLYAENLFYVHEFCCSCVCTVFVWEWGAGGR
jgi:hypothetical protein